ncbi:MAG: hypothetical protein ACQ5SW_00875 [Sphaerochaetaceae bacterium]
MSEKQRHFDTQAQTNEIVELLREELPKYLDVTPPKTVTDGSDFVLSSYAKPYVLVSAANLDSEEDGQCILQDLLVVRIGAYVVGADDKDSLTRSYQYADAIRSVFIDNDRLEYSYDLMPTAVDYYPGGTTNEKLCIVELEMKQRIARG